MKITLINNNDGQCTKHWMTNDHDCKCIFYDFMDGACTQLDACLTLNTNNGSWSILQEDVSDDE